MTLAKDMLLFLEGRGEEQEAENQQKVISALQDAKLRRPTKQSALFDSIGVHQSRFHRLCICSCTCIYYPLYMYTYTSVYICMYIIFLNYQSTCTCTCTYWSLDIHVRRSLRVLHRNKSQSGAVSNIKAYLWFYHIPETTSKVE